MLLKCPKCAVKNYLDPYPFWNYKGKTKCAGWNLSSHRKSKRSDFGHSARLALPRRAWGRMLIGC